MSEATNLDTGAIFNQLVKAVDPARQQELLAMLRGIPGENYIDTVSLALHFNPLLELPPNDRAALVFKHRLDELSVAKQLARTVPGKRICVFCLPKSGSSFTQSAIVAALNIPFVVLTSHAIDTSSLGMNGREQEMDELAIMYAIFRSRGSFVAQHHTRCTPFLCHQLRHFGVQPVITIRNVFDAMLSADEMFFSWRQKGGSWTGDSAFMLPLNYVELDTADRMTVLAGTFGIWAINFYISWRRCERADLVHPLWLTYEDDIAEKETFSRRITDYLGMNQEQSQRLAAYVAAPDKAKSRLNVGKVGRGSSIPDGARAIVLNHAKLFRSELQENDIRNLFGDTSL